MEAAEEPATSPEPKPFPAKKIAHVAPVYPKDAKEDGAQGIFLLEVTIDAQGRVSDVGVVVSTPLSDVGKGESLMDRKGTPGALTGDERLARAAIEAVRQWRYEPVLDEDGQPKAVDAILTVKFALS